MGTGLIRPAHGFPRRASGWQRRPPRAWRCRQPGRAWLAAVDQVYGFRVAIHLLEPPLTEMPGRSQVHEQPVPAAAPNGARATGHCAGLRAKPQGTAEARTDSGHGRAASGAGAAWVRSAARFRSARRSTPAGRGHQLREWIPQGRRLRGRRHARFKDRGFKGRYRLRRLFARDEQGPGALRETEVDTGRGGRVNAAVGIATAKRRERPVISRALMRHVRRLCFQLGTGGSATPGVDMRGLGLWFK